MPTSQPRGVVLGMFKALAAAKINVEAINTSEFWSIVVVDGSEGENGIKRLRNSILQFVTKLEARVRSLNDTSSRECFWILIPSISKDLGGGSLDVSFSAH